MKDINIEEKEIKVVSKITIDGVVYPTHPWNLERANRYLRDHDKKHLEELVNFSLDI